MQVLKHREHKCNNCGNPKLIQTNHTQGCIDYCNCCSWTPSFGAPENRIAFNGRTYRPFTCLEAA